MSRDNTVTTFCAHEAQSQFLPRRFELGKMIKCEIYPRIADIIDSAASPSARRQMVIFS
jgi:hypothetical protein